VKDVDIAAKERKAERYATESYDLQAGLLDDGAAARLRKRVRADPDAQQMVHALNRVRRDVATVMRAAPMSAPRSRLHLRATHALRPDSLPHQARVLAAGAGLAAATVAIGLGTAALIAPPAPTPSGLTTAQQITVSRPPMRIPLSDPQILALLARKPDYGPLADPQRRTSCLGGLAFPASAQIVGAQPVEIAGRDAVLLVLSGDTAGSLTALAVAPTCSSLNTGLLADRVVNRP
jgi:hypothetical protein